jgi:hypothetical protein
MKNQLVAQALACQFIDHIIKTKSNEHPHYVAQIAIACQEFLNLATSSEVAIMLREGDWRRIDTYATDDNVFPERGHLDRFLRAYFGVETDVIESLNAGQIHQALAYLHELIREYLDDSEDDGQSGE